MRSTPVVPSTRRSRGLAVLAAGAALAVTAAGCSSSDSDSPDSSTPAASSRVQGAEAGQASGVEVHEAWVRATDTKMTGVFGMIHNHGSAPAHIVSATSALGGTTQLHQTLSEGGSMQMREAEDGFRIPAGGELELKPGGDHIMLMGLTAPVATGQQVQVTLTLEGGQTVSFTATGRAFEGGNEQYGDGSSSGESAAPSAGSSSMPSAPSGEGHAHSHDHG